MFHEISARWPFLVLWFTYLSPGSNGKKWLPLNHIRHPFHPRSSINSNGNFYIQMQLNQLFLFCGSVSWCKVYLPAAHALFQNHSARFGTIIQFVLSSILYTLVSIDAKYMALKMPYRRWQECKNCKTGPLVRAVVRQNAQEWFIFRVKWQKYTKICSRATLGWFPFSFY